MRLLSHLCGTAITVRRMIFMFYQFLAVLVIAFLRHMQTPTEDLDLGFWVWNSERGLVASFDHIYTSLTQKRLMGVV